MKAYITEQTKRMLLSLHLRQTHKHTLQVGDRVFECWLEELVIGNKIRSEFKCKESDVCFRIYIKRCVFRPEIFELQIRNVCQRSQFYKWTEHGRLYVPKFFFVHYHRQNQTSIRIRSNWRYFVTYPTKFQRQLHSYSHGHRMFFQLLCLIFAPLDVNCR